MAITFTVRTAPGALPLLGHTPRLRKGLLEFLAELPAQGDLVEIRVGAWRGYVACHPDLVQQMLRDDATFDRGGPIFEKARAAVGNGLVTCPRSEHRQQRRLLQPAFGRDRIKAYAPVMTEQIATELDGWREGQILRVCDQTRALVTRVLARSLFTTDWGASTAVEQSLDEIMRGLYWSLITPSRLPVPGGARYRRALTRTRAATARAVREHRCLGTGQADLLTTLLAARDGKGRPLAEVEIHDQILTVLMAGIETTSNALAWSLDLLAHHPAIQQRLHAEATTVLGNRTATWDDLPRLDLATRVMTEALRLYPPGWIFTRITSRPTEIAGRLLPAGTIAAYSPYLVHHRRDLYPAPDSFDPDRWPQGQGVPLSGRGWVAFGAGARKCLGDAYAQTLARLTLSSIAARWQVEPTTSAPTRPGPRITLAPTGLRLRLRRRPTERGADAPA